MMRDTWNVATYSQFLDLRTRPARDLLNAIPLNVQPKLVYDLGCGPGNSTILLKTRWPDANVIGIDSSAEMITQANKIYPEITFIKEDIADLAPNVPIDCLFANASLQWLDHHEMLLPKLVKLLSPNGILAIQMPNNFHSPTHQVTIKLLQRNSSWQPLLKNLRYGILTEPFYKLSWYYDLLSTIGLSSIQLWETEYWQEMTNHEEIFAWVKGTGLRNVLSDMDPDQQNQFATAYVNAISQEYPLQKNQTVLLPFKRIFIVCSL